MTGPWHYREAERLVRYANGIPDGFPGDEFAQTMAQAQVHATLALAAATALRVTTPEGMGREDKQAWREVAASKQTETRAVA
jgi:hypothetical protein